jgi:plasmid stability protein
MASLLIKNISEELKKKLKEQAEINHCSINKQVVLILERALTGSAIGPFPSPVKTRSRLSAEWVVKATKWGRH